LCEPGAKDERLVGSEGSSRETRAGRIAPCSAGSMPEVLTKHPDVVLEVLKAEGAQCGVGLRPKILKDCPQDKLCVLKGGELCVYGPTELGLMTQLTREEVCGAVPTPRAEGSFPHPAVGIGLAVAAVATVTAAATRARRRRGRAT